MRRPASYSLGAILFLVTHLAACTEWHVEQVPPQALLDAKHPTRVRVTRRDSTRIVLAHPSILGDSLVGQLQGHPAGVAVADIATVAIHRTNVTGTVLLIGGIVLVTAGAAAAGNSMNDFNIGGGADFDGPW